MYIWLQKALNGLRKSSQDWVYFLSSIVKKVGTGLTSCSLCHSDRLQLLYQRGTVIVLLIEGLEIIAHLALQEVLIVNVLLLPTNPLMHHLTVVPKPRLRSLVTVLLALEKAPNLLPLMSPPTVVLGSHPANIAVDLPALPWAPKHELRRRSPSPVPEKSAQSKSRRVDDPSSKKNRRSNVYVRSVSPAPSRSLIKNVLCKTNCC